MRFSFLYWAYTTFNNPVNVKFVVSTVINWCIYSDLVKKLFYVKFYMSELLFRLLFKVIPNNCQDTLKTCQNETNSAILPYFLNIIDTPTQI